MDITPGNKVHYCTQHGTRQNGIIKSLNDMDQTVVFVVYNCAGEWDNYQDYTGASTKIADLKSGWINDKLNDTYNEVVRYELDNIEADLDNIFLEGQDTERTAVVRVIAGLRNTRDQSLLEMDKSTLTLTFLYNQRATRGQMSLAAQLERLLNDKIQGLWDVTTTPTELAD